MNKVPKIEDEHERDLEVVLGRLKVASLSLNRNKYHFSKKEIKILGQVVSNGSVKLDTDKDRTI